PVEPPEQGARAERESQSNRLITLSDRLVVRLSPWHAKLTTIFLIPFPGNSLRTRTDNSAWLVLEMPEGFPMRQTTIGDKYLLGAGRSDHDRLRVISEIHDSRTRELLRRAGFVSGRRFVEFGCGLGYVTRWAASLGAHATGIDLNEDNLAVATELAQEAGL